MRKSFFIRLLKWISGRKERRAKRLEEKLERMQRTVFRLNETIAVWDDNQNINFVLVPTSNEQSPSREEIIKKLKNQQFVNLALPTVMEPRRAAPHINGSMARKDNFRNPTGRPPSMNDKRLTELKIYHSQGMSKAEIGRRLGVTPVTVTRYIKKLGI